MEEDHYVEHRLQEEQDYEARLLLRAANSHLLGEALSRGCGLSQLLVLVAKVIPADTADGEEDVLVVNTLVHVF